MNRKDFEDIEEVLLEQSYRVGKKKSFGKGSAGRKRSSSAERDTARSHEAASNGKLKSSKGAANDSEASNSSSYRRRGWAQQQQTRRWTRSGRRFQRTGRARAARNTLFRRSGIDMVNVAAGLNTFLQDFKPQSSASSENGMNSEEEEEEEEQEEEDGDSGSLTPPPWSSPRKLYSYHKEGHGEKQIEAEHKDSKPERAGDDDNDDDDDDDEEEEEEDTSDGEQFGDMSDKEGDQILKRPDSVQVRYGDDSSTNSSSSVESMMGLISEEPSVQDRSFNVVVQDELQRESPSLSVPKENFANGESNKGLDWMGQLAGPDWLSKETLRKPRSNTETDIILSGDECSSGTDEHGNRVVKLRKERTNLSSASKRKEKDLCKKMIREWCNAKTMSIELRLRNRGLHAVHHLNKIYRNKILCKTLQVVDLSRNRLKRFPKDILNLESLTELHLDYNKLTSTSFSDMSKLTSLSFLSLRGNKLAVFPKAVLTLTSLEYLSLEGNCLESLIPPNEDQREFVSLLCRTLGKTLIALNLSLNNLSGTLDPAFCEALLKLEQLSIHTNKLTALPPCFEYFDRLRVLQADGNNFVQPPDVVLRGGPSMVRQYFKDLARSNSKHHASDNELSDSSSSPYSTNVAMKRHAFARTRYAEQQQQGHQQQQQILPSSSTGNSALVVLDDDELFSSMEPSGSSSRSLEMMGPSDSLLMASAGASLEQPPFLGRQTSYANTQGSLAQSQVIELKEVASPLDEGHIHNNSNNSNSNVPELSPSSGSAFAVNSPHQGSMMSSQSQVQSIGSSSSKNANKYFKIVVLGHASAGKSSFCKSFLGMQASSASQNPEASFGVDMYQWKIDENDQHQVTMLDFLGEDVYYQSHQLFVTSSKRALYLVVWDVTKFSIREIDSVIFWVYSVQARAPGSVIQIVASKTDLATPEEIADRIALLKNRLRRHEVWQKRDLQMMLYEEERDEEMNSIASASIISGNTKRSWVGGASFLNATTVGTNSVIGGAGGGGGGGGNVGAGFNCYHDIRPKVLLRLRPVIIDHILQVSSREKIGFPEAREHLRNLINSRFPSSSPKHPVKWGIIQEALQACKESQPSFVLYKDLEARVTQNLSENNGDPISTMDISQYLLYLHDLGELIYLKDAPVVFLDPKWIVDCIKRIHEGLRSEDVTMMGRTRGRTSLREMQDRMTFDIRQLKQKGILCERLLKRLWPELFRRSCDKAVHENLIKVLEHFDICSPIPPDGSSRRWLIPSLITSGIKLENTFWAQHTEEEVQIGRSFVFMQFIPSGLIPKIVKAISEIFDPKKSDLSIWKDAIILRLNLRVTILIQLGYEYVYEFEHDDMEQQQQQQQRSGNATSSSSSSGERAVLNLFARGCKMSCLYDMWVHVSRLKEKIESILLNEYMGITWIDLTSCPVCITREVTSRFHLSDVEQFADNYINQLEMDWQNHVEKEGKHKPEVTMVCQDNTHMTPLIWLLPPPNVGGPLDDSSSEGGSSEEPIVKPQKIPKQHHNTIRLPSGVLFDARCITRIGVYCTKKKRFVDMSTGYVLDREKGWIVTAAHLIFDPKSMSRKFFFEPPSTLRLLVGCFQEGDDVQETVPSWTFESSILVSGESVSKEDFVDVLILKLERAITASKATVFGSVETAPMQLEEPFSPANFLTTQVEVGEEKVEITDSVSLIGFPLRNATSGESVCMDSGFVVGFVTSIGNGRNLIQATPWNASGSSGGPLIDRHGRVIGLLSFATSGNLGVFVRIQCVHDLLRKISN